MNKSLKKFKSTTLYCIAGNRSWLYSSSPDTKIIMYKNFWCTAVMWKFCTFLAVNWVGMMTLRECRVDRPFPYHVIRCWMRTRPPPTVRALYCIFKPTFWRLTLSTPKRCHMDLWSAQLALTHHHSHRLQPSLLHQHPESKVCNSFFLSIVFFSGGCLLPFSVKQRAAFQLSLSE